MPPFPSPPEFFLDRSLARRVVAEVLRDAGWTLRTHIEVFGDRDQVVRDVEWLELCGQHDWVVLSMDRRIRYHRDEVAAIRRHAVRAFVLATGNLAARDQARRLVDNEASIFAACVDSGPFVYAVYAHGIERIFPS